MIAKADPRKLPAVHRRAAYDNPGEMVLLHTGAKVVYVPGRTGYRLFGYLADGSDLQPYLKEAV